MPDLVVFADEHHTYYGNAFSAAVRNLRPRVLLGLTATPHKRTPPSQIIYRYPLVAAIADKLVKTPVLVGRKDDRVDPETKLLDGVRLLELKEEAIKAWGADTGVQPIAPIMLVIAPTIAEAKEITGILMTPSFAGGRYVDSVLEVHSDSPDEALAALDRLEDADNPYRVVISVGMLKEGWDVKNVYVIASMRASVSDILTEQTLGRGLRLPFGRYTGIEFLDTLEVLGHERYEELLRKAGVLKEQFVDWRTQAVLKPDSRGRLVPVTETTQVQAPIAAAGTESLSFRPDPAPWVAPAIRSVEEHTEEAKEQVAVLKVELTPRTDRPPLRIPLLRMTEVRSEFSLADITELEPFRRFGESLAADPVGSLRRVTVSAEIITGSDGLRRTELVTAPAMDRVESPAMLFPLDELREQLLDQVLGASVVPARVNQRKPARDIVNAMIRGLGGSAATILSGYMSRAAAGLIQLITDEHRRFAAKPSFRDVTEVMEFAKVRIARSETSQDRFGAFKKSVGYEGYTKTLYAQDWFDSSPERDVANILDTEEAITLWMRLQTGDLPILWSGAREYNPDFIAIDTHDTHWVIEVKMDKEMKTAGVQGKREAARRWANHVSADDKVGTTWRYLLLSETDVRTAKGSWEALIGLGGAFVLQAT